MTDTSKLGTHLLDHELLRAISARISAAGRAVFAPHPDAAPAPLAIKVDTYVLETDLSAVRHRQACISLPTSTYSGTPAASAWTYSSSLSRWD